MELALLLLAVGDLQCLELASRLLVDSSAHEHVVIISHADLRHGNPVVLVDAKDGRENNDEDKRGEKRSDVASKHRVVGPSAGDVENTAGLAGGDEPSDDGANETENGRQGCGPAVLTTPEKSESGRDDGGRDQNTHENVEVSHADAVDRQADGDAADDESVDDHDDVRHPDKTLSTRLGVEIGTVNVVGCNRGHGDELRVERAGDGKEDHDQSSNSTTLAEESDSGVGEDETSRDVGLGHAVGVGRPHGVVLEGEGAETHGGGGQPRDGEPCQASHDVPGERMDRGSSNRLCSCVSCGYLYISMVLITLL